MKCPKCGYHSFEHLDDCKKCGQSLADHKAKFNLRGFCAPGQAAVSASAAAIVAAPDVPEPADDGSVDFGFDFLDEEEDQVEAAERASLDSDDQDINIDQPFEVDSETVPADDAPDDDSDNKPDKGPEFAF